MKKARAASLVAAIFLTLAASGCSESPPPDPYRVSDVTLERQAKHNYVVKFAATWSGDGDPIEALCIVRVFGEPEVRVGYAEVETADEAHQRLEVPVRTSAPGARAVAECGPAL